MARPLPAFASLVGHGLSFAFLRRPRSALALAGFGAFLAAWALCTLAFLLVDGALTPSPRVFESDALPLHAGFGLALLALAWLSSRLLRRPATWLTLASLVALAAVPWTVLGLLVGHWTSADEAPWWVPLAGEAGVWLLMFLGLLRLHWAIGAEAGVPRRAAASLLAGLLLIAAWTARADAWFWYPEDPGLTATAQGESESESESEAEAAPQEPATPAARAQARGRDPEVLLGRQPALVAAAVAALAPQDPARVDLYAIGFAGDGKEPAFRNEVEYLGQLLSRRFGAGGRMVPLINHPGTRERVPLATVANLQAALAGIGATMDREQDVLLLFLTSHGSPEHWLVADLPPLPLRQVHPGDIRDALDAAGIRWRVVVVSACYSGGFIEKLRDPHTLVITAASADRPSFGCGAESEITWFGQALLARALNRTTDFREAYAIASREVRARELEQEFDPSSPQIWGGERVDAQLDAWRAGLAADAPAVPFVAAVKVDAKGEDETATEHVGAAH